MKLFTTFVLVILLFCVVAVIAAEDNGAVAATPKSNKKATNLRFSNAWLPDWLPNIHKLNQQTCKGISEFRQKSPAVKQLVSEKSDPNTPVSIETISSKLKLATKVVAGGSEDHDHLHSMNAIRKAAGYKMEKVAGHSKNEPRVLCLGFSHKDMKDQSEGGLSQMYNTWAKHCDNTLLYTRHKSISGVPAEHVREIHPILGDAPHNLWQKMRLALSMLSDPAQDGVHLENSDFVVWFGDDSFFSVTNLKQLLVEPYIIGANRANALLYLGHRMADNTKIFNSNLGYIMNRQLVRILADLVNTPACDPMAMSGSDDMQLGSCFENYGIQALDTYDEIGEDRMLMWEPDLMAYTVKYGFPDWYIRFRNSRPVPKSLALVSQHAVAFHNVARDDHLNRVQKLVGEQ